MESMKRKRHFVDVNAGKGGVGFRIHTLHAALAVHADGDEGVVGLQAPDGTWVPLVAADKTRLDFIKEAAREIADQSGMTVRICRFTTRVEVQVIRPALKEPEA